MSAAVLVIMSCLNEATLFDCSSIELKGSGTRVFLAQGDAGQTADIFVLSEQELSVYSTERECAPYSTITFEPGTSAFDVADLDDDGRNEVVAVCGERIMRYDLQPEPPPPLMLFECQTLLADGTLSPYPYVLAIERGAKCLLALPCEGCVDLRSPDGALVTRHQLGAAAFQDTFKAWSEYPTDVGPPEAIQLGVRRVVDLTIGLPEELGSDEPLVPAYRQARPSQMYDAVDQPYTAWPWFPLKTDGGIGRRALYAKPRYDKTLVRIYEGPADLEAPVEGEGVEVGPPKLYPGGIVVTEEDLPDFNGDGYVDLVLRSAPEPKLSVGSITRAVTGGSWPLHVTMHLFSPEDNKYEPKPFAKISCRIPPFWFVVKERGAPMRNCVFRDFNGDGFTDCGWCIAEDEFAVWLCEEGKGFRSKPDWTYRFPEEGVDLEFAADLDGSGRTSLAFRGKETLYVFHSVE